MELISWGNFPLPLIQVNPPKVDRVNQIIGTAYANGIFSNSGKLHTECSKKLAIHVRDGLDGYLTCSNTSGLAACLLSLDIRGKHVVLSNFTFAATLQAVLLAGGIPVLCDISETTLELDIVRLSAILEDVSFEVAAVIPTRVFGFINDHSEIVRICTNRGIPVVTDAAASFPALANSWNFKQIAKLEVFSLHATKVFGIGEGGLVVGELNSVNDVRERANFGLDRNGSLNFKDGINAKADEFTSARALARYSEYADDVKSRKKFAEIYKDCFKDQPHIQTIDDNEFTVYSYFPVIFSSEENLLKFQGIISPYIMTRRYYFPTIREGYKGKVKLVQGGPLEVSESIAPRILCLPVYVAFDEEVLPKLKSLINLAIGSTK